MASLGRLVAEMALDGAQFFSALDKAEYQTQQFAKKFDKSMMDVGKTMLSLAATVVGATALIGQFKESLDYAAQIDKLVKQTDIAAESMDRLGIMAKQNDTDIGALAKIHKELGESMVKSTVEGTKEEAIFKALGLSARDAATGGMKSMSQMMGELASVFKEGVSPAEQMVVVTALLGKQGVEMLPILKNWTEEQEKAKAVQEAFGAVTDKSRIAADDLGDSLTILGEGMRRSMLPVVEELGDMMPKVTKAFMEFASSDTVIKDSMTGIGKAIRIVIETIAAMILALAGLAKASGQWIAAMAVASEQAKSLDFKGAFKTLIEGGKDVMKTAESTNDAIGEMFKPPDVKPVATAYDFIARMVKTYELNQAAAAAATDKNTKAQKIASTGLDDYTKAWIEFVKVWDKAWEEGYQEITKQSKAIDDHIKNLEDEAYAVGATALEIDLLANTRKFDALMTGAENDEARKVIQTQKEYAEGLIRNKHLRKGDADAAKNQVDAMKAEAEWLQKNYDEQLKYWEDIADKAGDFFAGFLDGSKKASDVVKQLTATIKATLMKVLFDMTVRPFIVKVGMALTGAAVPGMASASGGGGDLLSSLFGGSGGGGLDFSSLFGNMGMGSSILTSLGAGITGLGGNFFGGLGSGIAGISELGAWTAGMGSFSAAGGAFAAGNIAGGMGSALAGVLGTVGAAMPYIAAAYMIANALGVFDRGGPKGGGFATSGGNFLGPEFKGDNFRYFTPNDSDSMMQKLVDGLKLSYDQTLKALGGKGNASFAAGFDVDPQGTASNRAHIGAYVNGKLVYDYKSGDDSLGRSDEELKKALDIESKRALLAALQASDLPAAVGAMLKQTLASTATEEEIAGAIEGAGALKVVLDTIVRDPLVDLADVLKAAGESPLQKLNSMGAALIKLTEEFDGSTESAKQLAAATGDYYKAQIELLAQIEMMKKSLVGPGGMFENTAQQFKLDAMTNDEQYKYWQDQQALLLKQLEVASDPAEIARLSQAANQAFQNAWNLMTPEQQKASLKEYLDNLKVVQDLTEKRLNEATDTILTAVDTTLTSVGVKLDDFATKINDAAKTQNDAALKQLAAANMPVKVDVTVTLDPATEVNV